MNEWPAMRGRTTPTRALATSHPLVEMLAILRINRRFMEFMRDNYPDLPKKLALQHFGTTLVKMDASHSGGEISGDKRKGASSSSDAVAPASASDAAAPAAEVRGQAGKGECMSCCCWCCGTEASLT